MAKKKFYAVASGRKPGIYTSWADTEAQVKGYASAMFKGFPSKLEAETWMKDPKWSKKPTKQVRKTEVRQPHKPNSDCTEIYTDGGAINNPGPGGYGAVIREDGTERELTGGYTHTTNNRMELMACIKGIENLESRSVSVALFSDSKYVVNGISKGWAKNWRKKGWIKSDGKPAVNPDLWERLLDLIEGMDIHFNWVKGHAGHPLNERCDKLAVKSARGNVLDVDDGYVNKKGVL